MKRNMVQVQLPTNKHTTTFRHQGRNELKLYLQFLEIALNSHRGNIFFLEILCAAMVVATMRRWSEAREGEKKLK